MIDFPNNPTPSNSLVDETGRCPNAASRIPARQLALVPLIALAIPTRGEVDNAFSPKSKTPASRVRRGKSPRAQTRSLHPAPHILLGCLPFAVTFNTKDSIPTPYRGSKGIRKSPRSNSRLDPTGRADSGCLVSADMYPLPRL